MPSLSFDPKWIAVVREPVYYRCYNPRFAPLSLMGSIADGGRFNIGGSQAGGPAKTFGTLAAKRGALYLAESWQTALMETYSEVAHPDEIARLARASPHIAVVKVTPKTRVRLHLIDFESAVKGI